MSFCVGVAETIITPPIGTELAGYAFGPSSGILDHLKAQAVVVDADGTRVAMVAADLLGFGQDVVRAIRDQAQEELDIPAGHILLSASHSHSAPGSAFLRQWGPVDTAYVRCLEEHILGILRAAQGGLVDARLGYGMGRLDGIAENRRGQLGLVDRFLPIMRFDALDGSPLALVFSYGCHPVSLHSYRNLISPDYPGYAREVIRGELGSDILPMFFLGAAGDTNPAGYVAGATTPQRSREIGGILGREAARLALLPVWDEEPVVAVAQEIVELALAPLPPAKELVAYRDRFAAEAAQLVAKGASWERVSVREIKRDWAADALRALEREDIPDTVACEVQVIRMGSVAVIACPLEIFAETGMAIKALSPAAVTVIASNSNGSLAYLPTENVFQVESDYANPEGLAPKVYGVRALGPGAEMVLRLAAARLLKELFA